MDAAYRRMMTTPRIVVLGSINMDLTTTTRRLPGPGETVLGDSFDTAQGGKGANQAIAAARAGADAAFLGAVGDDAFAADLERSVSEAGVDVSGLRRTDGPSGIAAVTVDRHGENSIVVVPGANATMSTLTDHELDTIAAADILLCQLEIPLDTVVAGAFHARAHNTVVMLNPSPVRPLPEALVDVVDVLIVNESEADAVGASVLDRIAHVVTTLGANGARYRGPASTFDARAPRVDAIDTTGAGDAFTGALAARWLQGPEESVRWACAAGALAATRRGTGASSGSRADIDALIADARP